MKLNDIINEEICEDCSYDIVYIDDDKNVYDSDRNFIGTLDQFVMEDWGSSDWNYALDMLKNRLEAGELLLDAAIDVAEFYNDDHHEWENFDPARLIHIAQVRGLIDHNGNLVRDEDGNPTWSMKRGGKPISEASRRQWKRFGTELRKRYRCTSGPKKGKLVADPSKCASRRDPRKVRQGRRVMRTKKNVIARKSRISKRKQISKTVAKMNQRLMGKSSGGTMTNTKKATTGKGMKTKKTNTGAAKRKVTPKTKVVGKAG